MSREPKITSLSQFNSSLAIASRNKHLDVTSNQNKSGPITNMLCVTPLQPKTTNGTYKCTKEAQRPVTCPNQDCAKLVAVDSVLLHFYFEHNKVPLLSPDARNTVSISIDAHTISESSKCIALVMQHNNKTIICPNDLLKRSANYTKLKECTGKYSTLLLLMCAKYCPVKMDFIIKPMDISRISNQVSFNNETILLWFYVLQNTNKMYSIKISGDKKGVSHSYSGETMFIRDFRSIHNLYDKAECLAVRAAAISKLLNKEKMLKIDVKFPN